MPYTAPVWKSLRACGDAVEASLAKSNVLLTMGGEPTFVPVAPSGAEWQTAALGPTKLAYALLITALFWEGQGSCYKTRTYQSSRPVAFRQQASNRHFGFVGRGFP